MVLVSPWCSWSSWVWYSSGESPGPGVCWGFLGWKQRSTSWFPVHECLVTSLLPDDWSAERDSTIFQLGEVLHFQADVNTENHAPLRLFVDNCVASLTPDRASSPQYAFIDFSG